jgi:hypothetical protein
MARKLTGDHKGHKDRDLINKVKRKVTSRISERVHPLLAQGAAFRYGHFEMDPTSFGDFSIE